MNTAFLQSPRKGQFTPRLKGAAARGLCLACLVLLAFAILRSSFYCSTARAGEPGAFQSRLPSSKGGFDPRGSHGLYSGGTAQHGEGHEVQGGLPGDGRVVTRIQETRVTTQLRREEQHSVLLQSESEDLHGDTAGTADTSGAALARPQGPLAPSDAPLVSWPPKDRSLGRQLLERVAVNNSVIITIANYDHRDFAVNWAHHVRSVNLTNYLIAATEPSLLTYLDERNVPAYLVNISLPKETLALRSAAFNTLVRYKAELAVQVTKLGFNLLFADVDAIILKDPFPFFTMYPAADVLCSVDLAGTTARGGDDLENWRAAFNAQLNIGFTFFRASSHLFCKEWLSLLYKGDIGETWVQKAFNDVAKQNATEFDGGVFRGWGGMVRMGMLPAWRFCAGYNYFVRPVPQPEQVIMAHATKVRAQAKRHRLREAGLWHDSPPYFDHPRGFLALDPHLPPGLVSNFTSAMKTHSTPLQVELVNYQLMQVKHLLALASLTGRAAILPKFLSREDCTTPANKRKGLAPVPTDQIINIEKLAEPLPHDVYGPSIEWREAGFLHNPQALPLLHSTATVEVCSQDDLECSRRIRHPAKLVDGVARIPGDLAYEEISALLQAAPAKVVHLLGFDHLLGGFRSQKLGRQFEDRTSQDFAVNWAYHVRSVNLTNYLIAATEPSLLTYLDERNVPAYLVNISLPKETLALRSAAYNTLVRYKAELAVEVTKLGFNLLFADVDAIILKDPFPFFTMYPAADVLCSVGRAISTARGVDDLENWRAALDSQLNIGFTFFRASSHLFCKEWLSLLYKGDIGETWVQKAFNDVAKKGAKGFDGGVFRGWGGMVRMGMLPAWRFCAGHNIFVRPVPQPEQVIMAHATKVRAQAKRHRLREAGLWHDSPPYFNHPRGFLALDPHLPPGLVSNFTSAMKTHSTPLQVELVNYQLMQVKHLLALASLTGRAAILPKFLSREDCITPANHRQALVLVPADHVINIEKLAEPLPHDVYGPSIEWREAGFLRNPQALPLLHSTATVEVCSQDDSECLRSTTHPAKFVDGVARIPGDLAYEEISALLQAAPAKVVHLLGFDHLLGGFRSQKLGRQFEDRTSQYTQDCCCTTWEWSHPRKSYAFNASDPIL